MPIPWRSLVLIVFTSLTIPLFPAQAVEDLGHTTFLFDGFDGTNLIVQANASVLRSKSVLSLTSHSQSILGRALYSIPVEIKSNETVSSFSTTFVFSIVPPPSNAGGNGIAFFMTPHNRSSMHGMPSQYLGLLNLTNNGQPYNNLFAVEFDTTKNVEFNDTDGNHVGVDINNLHSVHAETAGFWNGYDFHELSLKSGQNIQAWIDYDHFQTRLNVSITVAGLPKPQRPLMSLKIDLYSVLQEKMFVGFSAATGNFFEDHYVLAWSFSTQGPAPPLKYVSRLPSFANMYSKPLDRILIAGVMVAALVLFSLAFAAVFLKRTRQRETIEEWEQEYWPHRITYKDLSIATGRFREENVLGQGGFGKVYKGVLPSNGQQVAVKCITKEFTEGLKGFIAEISSMGRLQHRNLVQLRGWCRRYKQLFIVYDYMPNGSLEKLIFGNPATVLPWTRRYVILKGVAAGLLYLHEQWEKRVIHRDIKSSNVLLDSEHNGRLGDFGLARLYDHRGNPDTTDVVGTVGYIAPELIQTGKATTSSDVFSFGVLLLEVACGTIPVDPAKDAKPMILVDWAWELYTEGRLLEASDPKLGKGGYDVGEMEKVLKLGLLCSHPKPEYRPGMRHVCQILEGEAALPDLCTALYSVSIMGDYPRIRGLFRYTGDKSREETSIQSRSIRRKRRSGSIGVFENL